MALNKNDLTQIDIRLDRRLKSQKEEILEEIDEKLDEKLANLKSEFFERIDPILKEVVTSREERPLIVNRLEKLEEIHPKGKHQLTS